MNAALNVVKIGGRVSISRERVLMENLLVRVHHIDKMSWLTGLAPWEF